MESLSIIDNPDAAACLLHLERATIVTQLRQPGSATSLARQLGWPRQRVGYHVRKLEKVGLLNHLEDRRAGNCVERILQASARCYVLSPEILGDLGIDPEKISDRFSSAYLIACACAAARDVGELRTLAHTDVTTLTLQSQIAFAGPNEQYQFARELEGAVADLVRKYHHPQQSDAHAVDLLLLAHPHLSDPDPPEVPTS